MRGDDDYWHPVATAPSDEWLATKREDEVGGNRCFKRVWPDGEVEWVDQEGRTTVTHQSFAPPTHWRWLVEGQDI